MRSTDHEIVSVLYSPLVSSLSDPDIILNTLSLGSSFSVRDQLYVSYELDALIIIYS